MFAAIGTVVAAIVGIIGGAFNAQHAALANANAIDEQEVLYQQQRSLTLDNLAATEEKQRMDIVIALVIAVLIFIYIIMKH